MIDEPKKLPAIVSDTNALISAANSPNSASRSILQLAAEHFQIVHSSTIWVELGAVIARKKFARYVRAASRTDFLLPLARSSRFVEPAIAISDYPDASENRFLELALCASAEIIISGDEHLRSMNPWRNIAILSPGEFLQRHA